MVKTLSKLGIEENYLNLIKKSAKTRLLMCNTDRRNASPQDKDILTHHFYSIEYREF